MTIGATAGSTGTGNARTRKPGVTGDSNFNPNQRAMQLNMAQNIDRRASDQSNIEQNTLRGDTMLSDDSINYGKDETRASVLDSGAPTRSYAAGIDQPLTAGGGTLESPAMEINRAQQQELRMRQTAEQFLGQQPEKTGSEKPSEQKQTETKGFDDYNADEDDESNEEDGGRTEEKQDNEMMRAQKIMAEQRKSQLKEQAKAEIKQRIKERMQKAIAKKTVSTTTRAAIEGTEFVASPSVITIILLILQLNIQLLNKYIFGQMFYSKEEMVGKPFLDQSLGEDVLTIDLDFMMTCGSICCNPLITCPIMMAAIPVIIVYSIIAGLL